MIALITGLLLFLKEIFLGTSSLRIGRYLSHLPETSDRTGS